MDSYKIIKKNCSNSAFTLIEILVVSTIIGLLAGSGISGYGYLTKSSRDTKLKADLIAIQSALEQYRNDNPYKSYPPNASFSVACGTTSTLTQDGKTYLSKIPTNPRCPTFSYTYNAQSASGYTLCLPLFGGSCAPPPPSATCNGTNNPCVSYQLYTIVEDPNLGSCKTICLDYPSCYFYCLGPEGPK